MRNSVLDGRECKVQTYKHHQSKSKIDRCEGGTSGCRIQTPQLKGLKPKVDSSTHNRPLWVYVSLVHFRCKTN